MALSNKIPKGWEKVQLEEVAKIKINSINPQKLGSEKFLLFSYPAYDRNKTPELTEGKNIKSNKLLLEEKCILFPKLNPSTPRIWYIKKFDEGYRRVSSTEFFPITPYSNNVNFNYLYYYLKTPSFYNLVAQWTTGTSGSHQRISKKSLLTAEILLPPLPEQRAIASVLSSLDDKIDLLHRQNKTLEAMAETLFRKWFIEDAKEDWEEKPLEKVCEIKNGYAFKSNTYQEEGQKIIRTLNFKNGFIDLQNLVYVSKELAKSFNKYYLKRKDFLLVMVGASIGNYAIVTKDVLPALQNQNMWCFRARQIDCQLYLNYYLKKLIKEKINITSGSAREFFQKKIFYKFRILVPDKNSIDDFNKIVEELFNKIENNRNQIRILEKLHDTLLPKLMSGEVRVKY